MYNVKCTLYNMQVRYNIRTCRHIAGYTRYLSKLFVIIINKYNLKTVRVRFDFDFDNSRKICFYTDVILIISFSPFYSR